MKIGLSLLGQLMAEEALKSLMIHVGEFIAKKTQNELDDKIVNDVKKAWKVS
jgi:hypothetical protein